MSVNLNHIAHTSQDVEFGMRGREIYWTAIQTFSTFTKESNWISPARFVTKTL